MKPGDTADIAVPYVEVAVPVPLFQTYHYSIPPHLDKRVLPGCRVLVPFGSKLQTGIALARSSETPLDPSKVKPVLQVLDPEPLLSGAQLDLARWVSDFYLAPLGETLRVFLPPGLEVTSVMMVQLTTAGRDALLHAAAPLTPPRRAAMELIHQRGTTTTAFLQKNLKSRSIYSLLSSLQAEGWIEMFQKTKAARVRQKQVQSIVLTEAGRAFLDRLSSDSTLMGKGPGTISEKQAAALRFIAEFRPPLQASTLRREAGATAATLKALQERGWIEMRTWVLRRQPFPEAPSRVYPSLELTEEQRSALQAIMASVEAETPRRFLLHGVTGSGKTEVYVRAAKEVLQRGGQVLVLVPEIGLTPAALQIFRFHFRDNVALLHSGLSEGERHDEWMRVRRGEVSVVIGTRSAVFAPLEMLRLLIIDEEHDASYKQDETPRYHAREVALRRAAAQGATLVLGSATPSVETFYRAAQEGRFHCLRMERRVLDRPLAQAQIVDMQEEFQRHGPAHIISTTLKRSIEERLFFGQQVLLLLNRRGYAPSLLCRSCGFVMRCQHCSVAMTYHQAEHLMLCHHCNRVQGVPKLCPQCQAPYIFYVGEGTERLQDIVQKMFPAARVDRMDSDTTARKGSYFKILGDFARGHTQILIGTQMIAKGHDFPNVTLAGVVAADQALAMPDFRAAERTFQLLTQVAGRSGRGEAKGEVIVQTRFPNHYSLKFACRQDYQGFFEHELDFRRSMAYPPFTFLANLITKGASQEKVVREARAVGQLLQDARRILRLEAKIRILGPNPAPLERLKGQYRYQILIKSLLREELLVLLRKAFQEESDVPRHLSNVTVDVDPQTLL